MIDDPSRLTAPPSSLSAPSLPTGALPTGALSAPPDTFASPFEPPTLRRRQRSMARNAGAMTVAEALGKIATLAYTLIAARALSQADFGAFAFALAFAGLLQAVPSWGFDALLIQRASREPDHAVAYFSQTVALRMIIAVPLFIIAGAAVAATRPTTEAALALGLVLAAACGDLYGDAVRSVASARQDQTGAALALVLQRIASCVVAIVLVELHTSLTSIALGYFVGAMVGVVTAHRASRHLEVVFDTTFVTAPELRRLGRLSWPIGISVIAGYLLFRLDAVMLGWMKDDAAVAAYSVAYRLFESGLVFSWTVGQAILPLMSAKNDAVSVRRHLGTAIGTTTFIYAPIAVVLFSRTDAVISTIFGAQYVDVSRGPLLWLAAAPLVFAFTQNLGFGVLAQNGERFLLVAGLTATAFNVLLNLWVIPRWGGSGAGAATLLAYGVDVGFIIVMLVRHRSLPSLRVLLAPLAGAASMALVLGQVHVDLVVDVGLGLAVFLAVWLVATRWVPAESYVLLAPLRTLAARVPLLQRAMHPDLPVHRSPYVRHQKAVTMTDSPSPLGVLVQSVVRRWWVALVVFVPVFGVAAIAAERLPDQYDGVAVVAFTPRSDTVASSNSLRLLISRYTVIASSPQTIDQVRNRVDGVSRQELTDDLVVTVPSDSVNVRIVVTMDDPQQAATLANAIAGVVVDAAATDEFSEASVVQSADAVGDPSGPPRTLYLLAGFLVAGFLALLAVTIATSMRPTIESSAGLTELGDVEVAGYVESTRRNATGPQDADHLVLVRRRLNAIRSNHLSPPLADRRSRVITVTGVGTPGASTDAFIQLVGSFGAVGTSVVVIDGSPEPSSLAPIRTDQRRDGSFDGVLAGNVEFADTLRTTSMPNVHLSPPPMSDVMSDEAAARLLVERASRSGIDIVFVYNPDLRFSRTSAFSALADCNLLVVQRGAVIEQARRTAEALSAVARTEILAVGFAG